jgi:dihydropteroate synthase
LNPSNFKIWAVINLTPDSFYAASRVEPGNFVDRCVECLAQGADALDIGAESTRPYSDSISPDEEWKRLKQPLNDLKNEIGRTEFFRRISIDTYKPETARKALETGVGYINDVRGGENPQLLKDVAEYNAGIVLMHSRGNPKEMQINPRYDNVIEDVTGFLQSRTKTAIDNGIAPENIIWDCGIGFGKTPDHNLQLINSVDVFKKFGRRLLYGISRKSFIDKMLNLPDVELRRDPTMIIHTILAMRGVDILRVHDVKETVMIRDILKHLR